MDVCLKTFIIGLVMGCGLTLLIMPFCGFSYDYSDEFYRQEMMRGADGAYQDRLETQRLQEKYLKPYTPKEPC